MRIVCWSILPLLVLGAYWPAYAGNIVENGDFSSPTQHGFEHWTVGNSPLYTGSYSTVAGPIPITVTAVQYSHAAAPGAQIGDALEDGSGLRNDSWIYQTINVPRDSIIATLTAYCQFDSGSLIGGPTFNWQEAQIRSGAGVMQVQLFKTNTKTAVGEWWPIRYDLRSYSGQAIQLLFNVHDDNFAASDAVTMWVDDVEVYCITATATISPTVSPTPTLTPTITPTSTITMTRTITVTRTITPTITPTVTLTPWTVPGGQVVAFPNPATGDEIHFMYSPTEPVRTVVDIYNLLGYRVAHLENLNQPGLANQRTTWNIRNVAPGVYLYRATLITLDGRRTESPMQRIIIAH